MKITVIRSEFEALLKSVFVDDINSIVPIASCFKIEYAKGIMKVTFTSIETTTVAWAEVVCDHDGPLVCAVDARVMLSTVTSLGVDKFEIVFDEGQKKLTLKTSNGKYDMPLEDMSEWPSEPTEFEEGCKDTIKLNGKAISAIFNSLAPFISNNELTPSLGGVSMISKDGGYEFVATDAKILNKLFHPADNVMQTSKIIGRKAVKFIKSYMSDGPIEMAFSDKNLFIYEDGRSYRATLVNAVYPDYKSILPSVADAVSTIGIDKIRLSTIIKVSKIYASVNTRMVRLYGENNILNVEAVDSEMSKSSLSRIEATGDVNISILHNAELLHTCLNAVNTDDVNIHFFGANKAMIITPNEMDHQEVMIMPILGI